MFFSARRKFFPLMFCCNLGGKVGGWVGGPSESVFI